MKKLYKTDFTKLMIIYLIFAAATTSCIQAPKNTRPKPVSQNDGIDKKLFTQFRQSVFEVVVPKTEDSFVKYEKPLPVEKLPFNVREDKFESIGTAFSVENGKFISAAHVFDLHLKANSLKKFFLRGPNKQVYPVTQVTKYHQDQDLIEFEAADLPKDIPFLKTSLQNEIGDAVFTVGNAQGEGIAVRSGQISSYTPEETKGEWNFIRFSAAVNPGNSGGPLVNQKGHVVGVVVRRNENENLNYAVPINMLLNLNSKQAHFYEKEVAIFGLNIDKNFKLSSWTYNPPLPEKIERLNQLASDNLAQLSAESRKKAVSLDSEALKAATDRKLKYARVQPYSTAFNIVADSKEKKMFNMISGKGKTIDLEQGAKISIYDFDVPSADIIPFYYTFGKDKSLKDIVEKPDFISEQLLQGTGWGRKFAGETVKIKSYGSPLFSKKTKDKFGRPWIEAKWQTGFDNKTIFIKYHPVPDGVVGVWTYYSTAYDIFQFQAFLNDLTDNAVLSYNAKLNEWHDYMNLDNSLKADYFNQVQIKRDDKFLRIKTPQFKTALEFDSKDDKSHLTLYRGINPSNSASIEFQGFIIYSSEQEDSYSAMFRFTPPDDIDEKIKNNWNDITAGTGKYDSKFYTEGREVYSISSKKLNNRAPSSELNALETAVITTCSSKKLDKETLSKRCSYFQSASEF
jgi:serine protease Do